MPNILLTRPKDRSEAFASEIEKCGWTSTIWPLLKIRPLLAEPIMPQERQSLIFTSMNAVEAMPEPVPTKAHAICVGASTAAVARRRGFTSITNVSGDAHKLVQTLLARESQRYLHVRGAKTRGDIAARLTQAGSPTDEIVAYEAQASDHAPEKIDTAIMSGKIDAVALFSPRSAAILKRLAKVEWFCRLSTATVFAISPATAEPVRDIGFAKVVVADEPNGSAMRAAICSASNE